MGPVQKIFRKKNYEKFFGLGPFFFWFPIWNRLRKFVCRCPFFPSWPRFPVMFEKPANFTKSRNCKISRFFKLYGKLYGVPYFWPKFFGRKIFWTGPIFFLKIKPKIRSKQNVNVVKSEVLLWIRFTFPSKKVQQFQLTQTKTQINKPSNNAKK